MISTILARLAATAVEHETASPNSHHDAPPPTDGRDKRPAEACARRTFRTQRAATPLFIYHRQADGTPLADLAPPTRRRRTRRTARGHIGLIVLGSIVAGLVLGLVLVLGVFGGSEEATITGAALISLGAEC